MNRDQYCESSSLLDAGTATIAADASPSDEYFTAMGCDGQWDVEFLRNTAWDISERRPADTYAPTENHVGLAMVNPCRGFAHWRILHEWIEETRRRHADAWRNCRMVLRLYDVSYITFTGLNANHIQDEPLPCICGQLFFSLPHAGTWQLGEVGFLLSNGEFIPAARSHTVSFPRASTSSYSAQEALLVDNTMSVETIGNLWEQERLLKERKTKHLRCPLRIAILSLSLDKSGPPEFVAKLAAGLSGSGHEVHLLANDAESFGTKEGIRVHPIHVRLGKTPFDAADEFCSLTRERLQDLPPFDIIHAHEWTAGMCLPDLDGVKVCSLTSLEATRRNGTEPNAASVAIEEAEGRVAGGADMVLTPGWLREKAGGLLRIDGAHVQAFAMEGRMPNEWDSPLDFGQVKREINFGPMDRLMLFLGPLDYAAGPDLLLDALPVLLQRTPNLRVAFAGAGELLGGLQHRARQMGIDHAVRFLGHVERSSVIRLLRASEALILPSRYRVPFDDAVVDLARLAGRPVVTTHGGPAHLVRHEETGIVTYDNSGSMVWALDRILSDPANAQRMGETGRRDESHSVSWNAVASRYLELCTASFPQLLC